MDAMSFILLLTRPGRGGGHRIPLMPYLLLLALLVTFPGEPRPTPTGEVWVEMVSAGSGKPREGVGRGVIEAPPERVFRALTDYAHWWNSCPSCSVSAVQPSLTLVGASRRLTCPPSSEPVPVPLHPEGETDLEEVCGSTVLRPGPGNVEDHRGS